MGMFTEWRDDEIAKLQQQLQEARAEIERRKADYAEMNEERIKWLSDNMKQEKLIEQMREALSWQCADCPDVNDYGDKRHCDECCIKRLLSAAERIVE